MSPRLLYVLNTRHLAAVGRDRRDRQLAASKYSPQHSIHAAHPLPA